MDKDKQDTIPSPPLCGIHLPATHVSRIADSLKTPRDTKDKKDTIYFSL